MTWYFTTLRADNPSPTAVVTHPCTVEGMMSAMGIAPK
jgi:hypothetical protein